MLRCEDCEFYSSGADGEPILSCDPCSTIKEPECLAKLQLVQMRRMTRAYEATLAYYQRLAPMQERMFKHVEREIEEMEQADSWRRDEDDEPEDPFGDDPEQRYP